MPDKFIINTEEGLVELTYNSVKSKKLISYCGIKPLKGLQYTAYVAWGLAIIVFVYDYYKDIARNLSFTKDLFIGQASYSKFSGLTKGNMSRHTYIAGLVILGILLFYLANNVMAERICTESPLFLEKFEQLIKYNSKGIPVEIVIPKK